MAPHEVSKPAAVVVNQDTYQTYFRPLALRGTDQTISSETMSPLGRPTTPKTTPIARKLNRESSESSIASQKQLCRRPSSLGARLEEAVASRKRRMSSETLTSHHSASFINSEKHRSISSKTNKQRNSDRQPSQVTVSEDHVVGGTRPGLRWKHQISSHLIEVRISKKPPPGSSEKVISEPSKVQTNPVQNDHIKYGPEACDTPLVETLNGRDATVTLSSSAKKTRDSVQGLLSPEATGGLYSRVKRHLRLNKSPAVACEGEAAKHGKDSETENMLKQASEMLQNLPDDRSLISVADRNTSRMSIAAVPDRRGGLFLRRSDMSAPNSRRHLFSGKQPMPSPDARALYRGSDNEEYFRVEMSTIGAPSFLPSEARRVGTPPLPSAEGGPKILPLRGFFFDYRPPGQNDAKSPSWEVSNGNSSYDSGGSGKKSEDSTLGYDRDWLMVKVSRSETTNTFEFRIPEHLPSSPLCPSNPKHTSGGNGICPYHGRAHRNSKASERRPS